MASTESAPKKSAAKKSGTARKSGAAKKGAAAKKSGAAKKRAAAKKSAGTKLRVTQVRSLSGRPAKHRATLEALGFRWTQQTLVKEDNPSIRGMLFQVRHLVKVEEVEEGKE